MPTLAVRTLGRVPLLSGLTADARQRVEAQCTWRSYERGAQIINYLDASRDVFIIVEGCVRVVIYAQNGRAVDFRKMPQGSMVGLVSAIDGRNRSATVETLEPCLVAQLAQHTFRQLHASEPTFAAAVQLHLCDLVRTLSERVYEFSTLAVRNRIHAELLRLVRENMDRGGPPRIERPPTHIEIASRISTHREAVTRELRDLQKGGLVVRDGRALVVTDLEKLERMVHEAIGE